MSKGHRNTFSIDPLNELHAFLDCKGSNISYGRQIRSIVLNEVLSGDEIQVKVCNLKLVPIY